MSPDVPITVPDLLAQYESRKALIRSRLAEFRLVRETADSLRLFEELVFCILAAGSSARMGIAGVEALRPCLLSGGAEEMAACLKHVRFHTARAGYILHTRSYLEDAFDFDLCNLIESFPDPQARRDFLASTKDIKGIGYKEASHFLRNVGYTGYGILDKHIVSILHRMGWLADASPPSGRSRYLLAESALKDFSDRIGLPMDEVDLLLWSAKTGEVLK
ncbi:MAG: N-glycosylase [Armatimonadetes bacterium]|nr:N-glycosylase [Armatimonadota bacterium]